MSEDRPYKLYMKAPKKATLVWDFNGEQDASATFSDAVRQGLPCALTFQGKVLRTWMWDQKWLRGVSYPEED